MDGEIGKVLARVRWTPEHRARLSALFAPAQVVFADRDDRAAVRTALNDAEVAIIDGVADDDYLAAPRLRWLHCDQSGIDAFAPPRLADSGLIVTSSKGRSAPVLAEHAVFFMLSLCHGSRRLLRAQGLRAWDSVRDDEGRRGLNGRKVCIVGLGATGGELARQCLAFDMRVTAYRRRSGEPIEGVEVLTRDAGASLGQAIDGADVLALCASLNDSSYRMVGAREIAAMNPEGFLVNIARAQLVDEAAMLAALRTGRLGGAGLDVADPDEPLPPWSPLWRAPNLLLTPHVTPQVPDRTARTLDLIAENLRRYRAGEPLLHRFTAEDVFTRGEPAPAFRGRYRLIRTWNAIARRFI